MLPRSLDKKDAYLLIVGNIIGVGIFTTTGYIAQYVPTATAMILLWSFGGILTFCGGITYSELSTRFPLAGGDFHYLSQAYHPLLGFLFGWAAFVVMYTGSIAVIAVGFSQYLLNLFPEYWRVNSLSIPVIGYHISANQILSIFIIFLFTYLNTFGIEYGSKWQNLFTLTSLSVLLIFIFLGFSSSQANWNHFFAGSTALSNHNYISGIGVALVGVFFTYSGWTVIVYIAGEIKNPVRTIPQSMFLGVLTVTVLYILIHIVYILAMPVTKMQGIIDVGYQALLILQGNRLSRFFLVMILLAILSTLNATILSGARIYFAMAQKKQFLKKIGRTHPKHQSPANALWIQFIWTTILILSGSFNQLLTYTVFVMVLFGCLSGIALFLLRKRFGLPLSVNPAWGYPVVPFIYIATSAFIIFTTLLNRPLESLLGVAIVLVGIPFYYYFQKINTPDESVLRDI
jgi:APA family basic amino acid/polyamine antiporter